MNTQELLDDIEDELKDAGVKYKGDRWDLLNALSSELNKLSGELDADCFYVHLNPAVTTVAGTRYYDLPANFGTNFVNAGGDSGDKWCCLYDDGTSETPISFYSNARFFSRSLRSESNGTPSAYTIVSSPNGVKQIALSPPPDTSGDTIDGLYKPTDWDLTTMDTLPPIPGNSQILKYAVLYRIAPGNQKWATEYQNERNKLLMEIAKTRKTRFVPSHGQNRNSYTLM